MSGQHKKIKGYGNRNYADSTKVRQIKFGFDVIRGENYNGEYYKKGTWIDVKKDDETYFIPSWVHEKDEENISFRTVANNFILKNNYATNYQLNHNLDYRKYKAVKKIKVELVGKVYDFKITDSKDPIFTRHFKGKFGYFKVGDKDEFGRIKKHSNYLPINGYKNDIKHFLGNHMKLGYKFRFSFLTSGDMFKKGDVAVITPTYKVLNKNGDIVDVDLYYKYKNHIKPISYKNYNRVVLNVAGRKLGKNELKNTAKVYKKFNPKRTYRNYLIKLKSKIARNIKFYDKIVLRAPQKTYVGKTNKVKNKKFPEAEKIVASVQKWYGDFYLPSSTLAVKKGTKINKIKRINTKRAPFLQKGVIIVNFKIDIYHDVKSSSDLITKKPYISYIMKDYGNQWQREGYKKHQKFGSSYVDYNFGDVAVYYLNKRAYNNYR